jgi:hypothetical protein
MTVNQISPPNTPIVDARGKVTTPWYRFFASLRKGTGDAMAGEVGTATGSGLEGGGVVADGVNLAIADGGVTDVRLRDSAGCSVIGRQASGIGTPSDVVATTNNMVLSRESNLLAFRNFVNGVSIGPTTAAPLVSTDLLRVATQTPASASATGTAGTIAWDASYIYVCTATDTWKRVAIATW